MVDLPSPSREALVPPGLHALPSGLPDSGDDDGFVDNVVIVHPQAGAECDGDPDRMWAHHWTLSDWPSGVFTTNDPAAGGGNIQIDVYTLMPIRSCDTGMIEIGIYCHELGHALGLRDLYDTKTSGVGCYEDDSSGIGWWGLMGSGNLPPGGPASTEAGPG